MPTREHRELARIVSEYEQQVSHVVLEKVGLPTLEKIAWLQALAPWQRIKADISMPFYARILPPIIRSISYAVIITALLFILFSLGVLASSGTFGITIANLMVQVGFAHGAAVILTQSVALWFVTHSTAALSLLITLTVMTSPFLQEIIRPGFLMSALFRWKQAVTKNSAGFDLFTLSFPFTLGPHTRDHQEDINDLHHGFILTTNDADTPYSFDANTEKEEMSIPQKIIKISTFTPAPDPSNTPLKIIMNPIRLSQNMATFFALGVMSLCEDHGQWGEPSHVVSQLAKAVFYTPYWLFYVIVEGWKSAIDIGYHAVEKWLIIPSYNIPYHHNDEQRKIVFRPYPALSHYFSSLEKSSPLNNEKTPKNITQEAISKTPETPGSPRTPRTSRTPKTPRTSKAP
ncbi:MAG: hypothetical protein ACX932_02675 [Gammaproteobacteria bacterium]